MNLVEIIAIEEASIILRARGSELLVLPNHVLALRKCKSPKDFTTYFLDEALINRPARKLFEAWLRKDQALWQRLYENIRDKTNDAKIQEIMEKLKGDESEKVVVPPPKKVKVTAEVAEVKKPVTTKKNPEKKATAEKKDKKAASKPKAEKKPAPKAAAKTPDAKKKKSKKG